MQIVSVRYAAPGGHITYKLAEVLGNYPALDSVRVRILTTAEVRNVNPRSIAWGLVSRPTKPSAVDELKAIQRKLDAWELEHLREHAAALAELVDQLRAEVEQWQSWAYSADARADMFQDLSHQLQKETGARVGLTTAGEIGVMR
jgi:hypothetical protein